jgi:hypothetical protein
MADLRKTFRLADELLTELKAQGQDEGDLGETLTQFLAEEAELMAMSVDQEPAPAELHDGWPVLQIEFDNTTKHYRDMDPDDGFQHDPTEYTTYYPESHPAVMSPRDAKFLVDYASTGYSHTQAVLDRLVDHAKGVEI